MKRLFLYFTYIIFCAPLSWSVDPSPRLEYESLDILNRRLDINSTLAQLTTLDMGILQRASNACNLERYPVAKFHLMNALAFINQQDFELGVGHGRERLFDESSIEKILGIEGDKVSFRHISSQLAYMFNLNGISRFLAMKGLKFNILNDSYLVQKVVYCRNGGVFVYLICGFKQRNPFTYDVIVYNDRLYQANKSAIDMVDDFIQWSGFAKGVPEMENS